MLVYKIGFSTVNNFKKKKKRYIYQKKQQKKQIKIKRCVCWQNKSYLHCNVYAQVDWI